MEDLPASPSPFWTTSTGRGAAAAIAMGDSVIAIQDTGKRLTLLWRHSGKRAWRTHVRGDGTAGPLLAGELVFTGTGGDQGHIYAYRLETARKEWDAGFPYLVGPLAMVDTVIYAASERGRVRALLSEQGRTVWETQLGSSPNSGVTVVAGQLVVATADSIFQLDATTGEITMSAALPATTLTPPAVIDGQLVFTSPEGLVVSVSADNFEELWSVELGDPSFGEAVIARDTVFVTTVSGNVWMVPIDNPSAAFHWSLDVAVRAPPAPISNGILVGTLAGDVLRLNGGPDPEWSARVDGPITVAPVISRGVLFVVDGRGKVHTWH